MLASSSIHKKEFEAYLQHGILMTPASVHGRWFWFGGGGRMGALRLRLGISTETLTSQDLAVNSSNSDGKQQQQFQANRINGLGLNIQY
jgi:hypothetical protein